MRYADTLPDEPTIGSEIANALTPVVDALGRQQEQMVGIITKSIADALRAVDSRSITVQESERPMVTQWVFKVERDSKGLMTSITATAK